jgi:hypothetical protein
MAKTTNGISLNLGAKPTTRIPLAEQIMGEPIGYAPDNGAVTIKPPKMSELSIEPDTIDLLEVLFNTSEVVGGNTQADVVRRNFRITEDGFAIKFSEEERARTLTVHRDDVEGFIDLLRAAQEAGKEATAKANEKTATAVAKGK